jgi:hypothetical protein
MRLAACQLLERYLSETSGDTGSLKGPYEAVASIEASVAPFWRHGFEAHRPAFEHGLQSVDAAITLSQALGPAEAVGRSVPHAELSEAEPAAWRVFGEPKPFGPSAAFWAKKESPRAATRELRMGDADEFALLAERYDGLQVLEFDNARGLEARYADANEFVEEDATVRVASALWHEL